MCADRVSSGNCYSRISSYTITSPREGRSSIRRPAIAGGTQRRPSRSLRLRAGSTSGKTGIASRPQSDTFPRYQARCPGRGGLTKRLATRMKQKKEMLALFSKGELFDTPKPERLLYRILTIATSPGDLVLDSFAGSGTTGAVAHKMGRRWIMVELGEHCHTHIIPRLKKVIDGEDPGGVTEAVGWKGGGGFRYYRLAPSLLEKDKWGNWVINKEYNAAMLAEAVCKLEGFTVCAERRGLLAARPLYRAGFHLRHHGAPGSRPAPAAFRRGGAGPDAPRALHRLPSPSRTAIRT